MSRTQYCILFFATIIFSFLFHEQAEKPFVWIVSKVGQKGLIIGMGILGGILLMLASIYMLKSINKFYHKSQVTIHLTVLILLCMVAYNVLMPYKSEAVHFLQYGLIGFLGIQWLRDCWAAMTLTYFMGVLDESYQFFLSTSAYLDYNDMVLNLLGSMLGVTLGAMVLHPNLQALKPRIRYLPFMANVCFWIVITILLLGSKLLCEFKEQGCQFTLIKSVEGFWKETIWVKTGFGMGWHRIKTLSGIMISCFGPLIFYPICLYLNAGKNEA